MLKKKLILKKNKLFCVYKVILMILFFSTYLFSNLEIENLKEDFESSVSFFNEEDFLEEDIKVSVFSKIKTHFRFRVGYNNEYAENLADYKFQESLYLYNRFLISYNDKLSLGYVFLHRPQEVKVDLNTFRYFLRKWWIKKEELFSVNKIIIGHYKINFGCGMIFNENSYLSNYYKNITPGLTRITPDNTSLDNANFRGLALEDNVGSLNYMVFFSQKDLIMKDTDYFVSNNDLLDVRNNYINYDKNLLDYNVYVTSSFVGKLPTSLNKETLFGLGVLFTKEKIKTGLSGYYTTYKKIFDPDKTKTSGYFLEDKYSDKWQCVFRGDRLLVCSFYYEMLLSKNKLFLEIAKSLNWFSYDSKFYQEGWGVNVGFLFPIKDHKFSLFYTLLQPTFFSPFGNPFKTYKYYNAQSGLELLNLFNFKNLTAEVSIGLCETLSSIWSGHFSSESPRYPSLFQRIRTKIKYKVEKITLEFKNYNIIEEKFINPSKYIISETSNHIQTNFITVENLYKIQYEIFKNMLIETRYHQVWENFLVYNKDFYTESFSLLFSYSFSNFKLILNHKVLSIDEQMNFVGLEQIWNDVYSFKLYSSDLSEKDSFIICYDRERLALWLMFSHSRLNQRDSEYNIRLQLDVKN